MSIKLISRFNQFLCGEQFVLLNEYFIFTDVIKEFEKFKSNSKRMYYFFVLICWVFYIFDLFLH